jgi:hypothetical protein
MQIGIGLRINGGGGAPGGVIDANSPAVAAYSTRRVRNSYAGSAIKVRRSSDNAESDIGYLVTGALDETTLTTFAGAGDAFVTTWYDQSGNGYNAVQATAASQPQIVASGVVVKEGSIPALNFDGANHRLALSSGMGALNNVGYAALFTVCRASAIDAVSRTAFWVSTAAAANPRFAMGQGVVANRFRFSGRRLDATSTQAINSNTNHDAALRQVTAMAQYTDAAAYLYGNGTLTASSVSFQTAGSTEATDSVLIGIGGSSVATWIGTVSELILYADDRTSTRAVIEANQIAYFGVV